MDWYQQAGENVIIGVSCCKTLRLKMFADSQIDGTKMDIALYLVGSCSGILSIVMQLVFSSPVAEAIQWSTDEETSVLQCFHLLLKMIHVQSLGS